MRSQRYGRRRSSSSIQRSTASPDTSAVKEEEKKRNLVRSVAGAFVACFSPSVSTTGSSNTFTDSDVFSKPRRLSVSSNTSTPSRERRFSESTRGTYGGPYRSVHRTDLSNMRFTMEEIYKATKNFSPSLKIGKGGFGTVYKGRLEDGTFVAIKRAKKNLHDMHLCLEFQSEIRTLAQVEHLNLVKFYGFVEHEEEKIVVEEFVTNGTLREHLECRYGTVLDLAVRLDIATDVAHALTYMHAYTDHPIIHRDIKSSNILLTDSFRAKVADFGFARLAADGDSGKTHVSTKVKGTAGYLDPEYLKTYQLTEMSDVYSFGVLMVELVTGRRPIEPRRELNERITVKWALEKFADEGVISILDPKLEWTTATNFAVEKILGLAWLCLATRRQDRPSMQRCAKILWNIRKEHKDLLSSSVDLLPSNSGRSAITREE